MTQFHNTDTLPCLDACQPSLLVYDHYGDTLVSASQSGLLSVHLMTPQSNRLLLQLQQPCAVTALTFSALMHGAQVLLVGLQDGTLLLYSYADQKLSMLHKMNTHQQPITALATRLHQSQLHILSADHQGKIVLSQVDNTISTLHVEQLNGSVSRLSVSEQAVAVGMMDGQVVFLGWKDRTLERLDQLKLIGLSDCQFNPGIGAHGLLMACRPDGQVLQYDLDLVNQKIREQKEIFKCRDTLYGLEYNTNGNMVALSTAKGDTPSSVVLGENLQGKWEVLHQ